MIGVSEPQVSTATWVTRACSAGVIEKTSPVPPAAKSTVAP